MKNQILIFSSPEELAANFADHLMNIIGKNNSSGFNLALSGGNTPDLLFIELAKRYPNSALWEKTHIWWVDERMVLPESSQSNYGRANELLLSKINIANQNIHRIKGENSPEMEVIDYSLEIKIDLPFFNNWPVFDMILLGMGEDGHTASIFPDQLHIFNSNKIYEIGIHPVTKQKRLTMTGKTINNASNICFLVTGENKSERIHELWTDLEKSKSLPISYIQPMHGQIYWYMDQLAAKKIL